MEDMSTTVGNSIHAHLRPRRIDTTRPSPRMKDGVRDASFAEVCVEVREKSVAWKRMSCITTVIQGNTSPPAHLRGKLGPKPEQIVGFRILLSLTIRPRIPAQTARRRNIFQSRKTIRIYMTTFHEAKLRVAIICIRAFVPPTCWMWGGVFRFVSRTMSSISHLCSHCVTLFVHVHITKQDSLNSTWKLFWHANNASKLCDVWIERGYRRNRTEIVEPKLMWRELSQPFLKEKRQLETSTIYPYQVNLFAVRRILQITNVSDGEEVDMDRHPQKHVLPLTKPNSLLLIRSSLDDDYIFEASCLAERDHIVHLLKLATARLVSHAVAGNSDLLIKEYFNNEQIP